MIKAEPQAIWAGLTDPETVSKAFFGAKIDTDWKPGSRITFSGQWQGKSFEDKGEVRSFEPGRRFSYTHQSGGQGTKHLVTVELAPKGEGTEVTITQANADGSVTDADREHKAQYEKTWAAMLEGVEKAAAH